MEQLGDAVTFYKIGYQLAYAGGLPLVGALASRGKKVFLDLKLHDIGNTVARGVESAVKLGATFLTVHAYPQTMKAAVEASRGTSLRHSRGDGADLLRRRRSRRGGLRDGRRTALVARRAAQARDIGVAGLVCSAEEAAQSARHCRAGSSRW